jgi:hypothetical protein
MVSLEVSHPVQEDIQGDAEKFVADYDIWVGLVECH